MAAPSSKELELLGEFRKRLKDLDLNEFLNSDMELLRWIRACETDLDRAELMLRKHLKWREEFGLDQLSSWEPPKQCQELMPDKLVGFDSENCPVVFALGGKCNVKKILQDVGPDIAVKSKMKNATILMGAMRGKFTSEGVPVTQYTSVNDLEGLSLKQLTLKVVQWLIDIGKTCDANFPESVKYSVIINAPRMHHVFAKFWKPFTSEKTQHKLRIFGKNPEEWKPFLKSIIPEHVMPKQYGGSNDIDLLEACKAGYYSPDEITTNGTTG